jgi:hypothetical protein
VGVAEPRDENCRLALRYRIQTARLTFEKALASGLTEQLGHDAEKLKDMLVQAIAEKTPSIRPSSESLVHRGQTVPGDLPRRVGDHAYNRHPTTAEG